MADIIGFDGKLSGGKTLTAIEFMKDDLEKGKKLISTIQLKNLPHKYIPSEELADFILENHTPDKQEEIENVFSNSSLLIDEARVLISGRKSSSNLNEIICQFLMMLGKLDTNCYVTFQRFSMIDIQLRQIMDYVLKCRRITEKGLPFNGPRIPYITPEGKVIPEQIKTSRDKLLKLFIEVKIFDVLDTENLQYTGKRFVYDPADCFKNYNTREIVIVDREKFRAK